MVDSHSAISCGPELKFLIDFHDDYTSRDHLRHARFTTTARQALGDEGAFALLGGAFVSVHERAAARAGKRRWADKNPENVLYADAWDRLLGEDWLLIHLHRDPADVLCSMEEAGFPYDGPDRVWKRIAHWRRHVLAAAEAAYRRPGRALHLAYEELVHDPRPSMERLMSWLGESFEDAQLDPGARTRRHGLEDPKAPGRRSIETTSVGRHRDEEFEPGIREELEALRSLRPASMWTAAQATAAAAPSPPSSA